VVIHRLADLDAVGEAISQARNLALGLLADCSTKIIYAPESGGAAKTAAALGLSSTEANSASSTQMVEWSATCDALASRLRERWFGVLHAGVDVLA
jgi:hypothetical protein